MKVKMGSKTTICQTRQNWLRQMKKREMTISSLRLQYRVLSLKIHQHLETWGPRYPAQEGRPTFQEEL